MSREQSAWDGADDYEDDEERAPRPRPGQFAARDDGWRRQVQAPVPSRGRVDVEQHLWRHSAESGALVIAVTLFAAWVLPASVGIGYVAIGGAALTLAVWAASRQATGSRVMAGYLAAWGVLVTAWFTWVRLTTPWHSLQISVLVITGLVLAVLGAPAIGHHRQRISAEEREALDLEATRPLRDWEKTLARNGAPGCTVLDVREFKDGGEEIRGRLPRSTRERQAITFPELAATAEKIAVSKRRNPDGVYFSQPELGDASEFVLHVRAKRVAQRAPIHLPAENKVLSVSKPLAVGVHDNGKPHTVILREIHVTIFGVTRTGKALALDTPIATPSGWTTMGELRTGDRVFDETGQPCQVLAATDVMYGRPCYEIEFSDGTTITADAEHQWLAETARSRRADLPGDTARRKGRRTREYAQPEVVTTEEMQRTLRTRRDSRLNYSVPVAGPLQLPNASLPISPYVLGVWLGDGWSATGAVTTADPDIVAEIIAEGETAWIMPSTVKGAPAHVRAECALADARCSLSGRVVGHGLCANHYEREKRAGRLSQWPLTHEPDLERREPLAGYRIGGLTRRLAELGVRGDKHIPVAYLRGSEAQRRDLLAGLLDTDGYCTKQGGAEFSNSRERLARDVYQLVCSLGYKATLRSKRASCNGKDCGLTWTVAFTPAEKVFRLTRKLAGQIARGAPGTKRRYVTDIRPVPSVPVRCIQVDSPDSLYLAGESLVPTHNSNLVNVFLSLLASCPDALIWMIDMKGGKTSRPWVTPWLQDFTPAPVIDWVATTREEAKVMLESALTVVRTRAAYPGFEKINPDEDTPALILVCDDVSACFGHGKRDNNISNYGLSQLGSEFTELAGGEAGVLIGSGQRANVELWGGTGMKAQSELRFGLRATSMADAGQIFPEHPQAAKMLTRLRDKGDCLVMHGPDVSEVVHLYRVGSEERITSRALWAGELRPKLEQRAATALGEAYSKRWKRNEDLLAAWRESAGIAPKPDFDGEFGEIVARLNDPEKPVSPHRQRAREIVRQAGWAGIKVGDVWNRLCETGENPPVRETVQRWFADDEQMGLMVRGQRGSQRWRWANLDDDELPGAM